MSKTFVTGLFKTRAAAEAAVDAIIKRGYTRDDISVLMSDSTRNKEFAVQTRSHAADGLGVGEQSAEQLEQCSPQLPPLAPQ